jgi:hypothetical protein
LNGYGLIVLASVAILLAGVETDPSADARERVLFQEGIEGFSILSLAGKIKKLGDGITYRAGLLTGGRHEYGFRLLKTPLPCVNDFRAAIGYRDNRFIGMKAIHQLAAS